MDAAEVARRFGLGEPARLSEQPVARGKQGLVWRLDTDTAAWAVKVPLERSPDEQLLATTAFQESARWAGVPTPAVRRTTEGRPYAEVGGHQVRVYEWVDLLPPSPRLDPALVGAAVARIHRAAAQSDAGTPEAWYVEPVGAKRWDTLVRRLREAGAPFADRLADLRDELVALESWMEPPRGLRTCHRDLWADNVLPTADGGVCVVDWDNTGPADQAQELACVLFEFARADPPRAGVLLDAYRDAGGPASVRRRGDFSMLIAQLGHITEMAAGDWLVPNDRSPERADAAAWVAEVLDEPHTRAVLDAILAEVAGPHWV